MAKKSIICRNEKKKMMVNHYFSKRQELKKLIKNKDQSINEKFEYVMKLAKMPKDSSKVRVRNRCSITGRGRGYYRLFGVSRVVLRKMAAFGLISGLTKASW